jgi:hypothetical protein
VKIDAVRKPQPRTLSSPKTDSAQEKEGFWEELFSGELNEIGVHLSPEHINSTMEGAHSLGDGLRKSWDSLRDKISGIFDIDKDHSTFGPEFRKKATDVVMNVAKGVGYTAAGVQGIGGLYKLVSGFREDKLGKKIDGIFDLSTSAAVATTIAGLGIGPLVLGPLAAAMGIVRGGYTAVKGFHEGNGRKEIQGALDATRSASVGLRLASGYSAALGTAGAIIGPIAGAIQLSRGYYDLSAGLASENKETQMKGLTDIASAAGLTLALTGIGTIPGIAITALAMGSRLLYQFNDRFESFSNRKLEKWNPKLKRAVDLVDKVATPVIKTVRGAIEAVFGRHRGDEADKVETTLPGPERADP